jgi:hypothetical protein
VDSVNRTPDAPAPLPPFDVEGRPTIDLPGVAPADDTPSDSSRELAGV